MSGGGSAVVIDTSVRYRLHAKVRVAFDPIRACPMLLYPERGLALNEVAYALVLMCDGEASVAQIVETLSRRFSNVSPRTIELDAMAFLQELRRRGLLEEAP